MNRISFLKRLLATLFGAASVSSLRAELPALSLSKGSNPQHAAVISPALGKEDSPTALRYLLSATVAGKQYHDFRNRGPKLLVDGEDIYTSIDSEFTEHPAQLVLEPDNPFDYRAIAVHYRGHKMGYIPRRLNKVLYNLLRDGAALETKLRLHIEGEIEPDLLYTYDFEFMYDMRVRVYLRDEGVADVGQRCYFGSGIIGTMKL